LMRRPPTASERPFHRASDGHPGSPGRTRDIVGEPVAARAEKGVWPIQPESKGTPATALRKLLLSIGTPQKRREEAVQRGLALVDGALLLVDSILSRTHRRDASHRHLGSSFNVERGDHTIHWRFWGRACDNRHSPKWAVTRLTASVSQSYGRRRPGPALGR
jgi:hypothetical protein